MLRTREYFHPRRLGHANLFVSDIDRSMAFYKEVVGLEEVYVRPPIKAGFLSNGNTHHDIGLCDIHGSAGRGHQPGLNHIGLELENEVDLVESYFAMQRNQVPYDRATDHDIAHAVYLRDPDGNQIEMYADTTVNWRTQRAGTVMAPTIKWTPESRPPTADIFYNPNPEIRRVEAAVFHPRRVTHVVLVVDDFEGCLARYTGIVGLDVSAGGAGSGFAVLGGLCHEPSLVLFRARPGRPAGLHHVGFLAWDEEDLDAAATRLAQAGLSAEVELDSRYRRCIHVLDPDGIRLQFYVDREGGLDALRGAPEDLALFLA
jgi:catechol 2,3-dioxygenase